MVFLKAFYRFWAFDVWWNTIESEVFVHFAEHFRRRRDVPVLLQPAEPLDGHGELRLRRDVEQRPRLHRHPQRALRRRPGVITLLVLSLLPSEVMAEFPEFSVIHTIGQRLCECRFCSHNLRPYFLDIRLPRGNSVGILNLDFLLQVQKVRGANERHRRVGEEEMNYNRDIFEGHIESDGPVIS